MLKKLQKKLASTVVALSSLVAITSTYAAETIKAAAPVSDAKHAGGGMMIWMPLILIAIFYFLIIRPQSKRQKQQRELISQIALGDEVMTNSGILGKITRLRDEYIVINIAKDTEVTLSRAAVSQVLPKGTIDSIN